MTFAECEHSTAHQPDECPESVSPFQRWTLAEQLATRETCASDQDPAPASHEDGGEDESHGEHKGGPFPVKAKVNAVLRRVIGARIAEARRMNGVDQMTFARAIGFTNSTQPSLWELGKRLPPLHMLMEAARVLGVSVDYLVAESDEFERDAKLAARSAAFRRVERLLKFNAETVAECLLDACASPGADELRVSRFASVAHALCEAVDRFEKLNAPLFEDARAGATLLRTCKEMREALRQVDRYLARAEYSRTNALQRARSATQAHRDGAAALT